MAFALCGNRQSMSAKVSGSVYEALFANKEIVDPFCRGNENIAIELMKEDYEYVHLHGDLM